MKGRAGWERVRARRARGGKRAAKRLVRDNRSPTRSNMKETSGRGASGQQQRCMRAAQAGPHCAAPTREMLSSEAARLVCVSGTPLGRLVVPLVWRNSATSTGSGGSGSASPAEVSASVACQPGVSEDTSRPGSAPSPAGGDTARRMQGGPPAACAAALRSLPTTSSFDLASSM